MAAEWIGEQRQLLTKTHMKCRNGSAKETVLEAFTVYLLRILNGLSQMESSKLYRYEAQILGEAMRLFCIHYRTQVDNALIPGISAEEKKTIIQDIEDAISKISNVYKNVIDSTANSDRQMFTSQAVETSIYDISPKLFATYSVILETLTRMFGKQEIYAFLLHPSLRRNIETANLFEMRKVEGKVVLIYIPENEIEKIGQIPTYLLHEVFHVLTKEERNRKDRACRMEVHIHNAIFQRIFQNVDFSFIGQENVDEVIKKRLMKRWFDLDKRMEELDKIHKNDRRLYSENVRAEMSENWRGWLTNIFVTLGNDLCQIFGQAGYQSGENPYASIVQTEWAIQRNLVEILAGGFVEKYIDLYMGIYREAYADIACVLAAGISAGDYERTFDDSEIVSGVISDVISEETLRALRIYIVAKVLSGCDGVDETGQWSALSDKNNHWKQKAEESPAEAGGAGLNGNDAIQIFENDLESFVMILSNSCKKLWDIMGQKDSNFERFRQIISQMNFVDILNGRIIEELNKL